MIQDLLKCHDPGHDAAVSLDVARKMTDRCERRCSYTVSLATGSAGGCNLLPGGLEPYQSQGTTPLSPGEPGEALLSPGTESSAELSFRTIEPF